ncbi:hypothetical protein [Sutcliffiella deserti]|uniref:hypothetical protein n=1 Tax=Sutcliffiella deserti TaxID=2875501 RepID=UPI001CC1339F|nr:hypothetical protein [Sutcliffiella deserti]
MQNIISRILMVIGFVVISFGFIIALIIATETSLMQATMTFFSTFVSGMLFIGFAEVIRLLDEINNKLSRRKTNVTKEDTQEEAYVANDNLTVTSIAEAEIREFFAKSNKKVQHITATPYEDYYIVNVEAEHVMVELGGFKPKAYTRDFWPKKVREWYLVNEEDIP